MIDFELLNEGTLIRHFSDKGVKLLQVETGAVYSDPIDIIPCPYTYEETEELIESDEDNSDEMNETEAKAAAYDILMGVSK